MTDEERAAPSMEAALKHIRDQFKGVARATQRLRLREALRLRRSITTNEARESLDIMHPAGRIKELRDDGVSVLTMWETVEAENGDRHRIARYVLVQEDDHA